MVQEKLYVFDWEYAKFDAPQSNDLIHFFINQASIRNCNVKTQVKEVKGLLSKIYPKECFVLYNIMILLYIINQFLLQVGRIPESNKKIYSWDGMEQHRDIIDTLI